MLTKLELHNFRQHKNLSLNFNPGVTVIRGANESGKSSLFEAITFALFGVDACRSNDLTTWGEPEKTHKVLLEMNIDSRDYTVNRSAKGAELNREGTKVTGQREVSRYCEQLLDLKPGTGSNLMFVSQNDVRGTLVEGSKSIQLIELLANFNIIESYIKTLQTEFSLGRTEHLQQKLQGMQTNILQLEEAIANYPDIDKQEVDERKQLQAELEQLHRDRLQLKSETEQLQQTIQTTQLLENQRNQLQVQIKTTQNQLNYLQDQLKSGEPNLPFPPQELSLKLEQLKKEFEELTQINNQYQDYQSYARTKAPALRLKGSKESISKELDELEQTLRNLQSQTADLQAEKKQLQLQICTELICPKCKREWDNAEELQRANNELEIKIQGLSVRLEKISQEEKTLALDVNAHRIVLNQPIVQLPVQSNWRYQEDDCYPPVLTWTGRDPKELSAQDVQGIIQKIDQYGTFQKDLDNWNERQKTLQQQIENSTAQLSSLQTELNHLAPPEQSSNSLNQELQRLNLRLNDLQHQINAVRNNLNSLPERIQQLRDVLQEKKVRLDQIKYVQAETQKDIKDIQINNLLLKTLRTIKPQLANTIWQRVCNTISHYFSIMRDQSSIISKTTAGFEVDGHNTRALSGSTLDILGLAIRVALTKTFLPSCKMLLLDEPFAACDAERQAKMLGFITSAGFEQVIIVTHEDTTESVAEHLITL